MMSGIQLCQTILIRRKNVRWRLPRIFYNTARNSNNKGQTDNRECPQSMANIEVKTHKISGQAIIIPSGEGDGMQTDVILTDFCPQTFREPQRQQWELADAYQRFI
jgi:hypothetical protein